jgi:diketogulonate reductase-like aldo/keto reductase
MNHSRNWTRRDIFGLAAAAGLAPALTLANEADSMRTRKIPATGEALPVIGLGTYEVFDVSGTADELAERRAIVDLLTDKGGSLLDTSPMYNRSERIIGEVISHGDTRADCFLATKVWTDGKDAGAAQMARSAELMQTEVIDLMQVHNLRDLDTHFGTIREWQQDGRIRYNGITDYRESALSAMMAAMRKYKPQFIQINYSLGERAADRQLLPLAEDMGIAVLINRPYQTGALFRAVRGKSLPDWAGEFADSWGQFFLKYIVSHPAVSCVIPATSKSHHMLDNLGAGFGPLPDAATRERMLSYFQSL